MSPLEIMGLVHQTMSGDNPIYLANILMGKLVGVSFEPKGYEEWLKTPVHRGDRFEDDAKKPHLSVGTVDGFALYWGRRFLNQEPKPCLRLFTNIQSVAGINISTLFLEVDKGWFIRFEHGATAPSSVPAIVQLLD